MGLAQEHGDYQIIFIDEYRRTSMGWMRSMWLSRTQRQRMASREEVMAAMPLTSEVFFENKVTHTSGMPEEMVKVWGLDETRAKAVHDNDGFGQYVCPEKRRRFMKLMEREAFWEIFKKAITLVKGKAAAGHDFLTARLFRTLTEETKKSLSEYMRIAILKQDLSKEMMETILKWLPKDGRKSTYINNTTLEAPNLRPIGLNTAASKIFEYVLFLVQMRISPGEERVHPWMFAWHRGKYVYTAALIHELITEDSHQRKTTVHDLDGRNALVRHSAHRNDDHVRAQTRVSNTINLSEGGCDGRVDTSSHILWKIKAIPTTAGAGAGASGGN